MSYKRKNFFRTYITISFEKKNKYNIYTRYYNNYISYPKVLQDLKLEMA